jgi:phytoene/squalene synthetase
VLLVSGYTDEALMLMSDDICTGLQLANFYQDIYEDFERGRRYLPADAMARFGVTDAQIAERKFDERFRALMEYLVEDARARLVRGSELISQVDRGLAATLSLFVKGGLAILDAIAAQGYDTLHHRPEVSKGTKLRLLAGAAAGRAAAMWMPGRKSRSGVRS